jgi:hypothetical protein
VGTQKFTSKVGRSTWSATVWRVASGLVVALAIGLAVVGLWSAALWWGLRRSRQTYSRAIVRQLRRTGRPAVIRVSAVRGTWNPAGGEVAGRLFANGIAEYVLDDAGVVHLRFCPKSGAAELYEGPVPAWHDTPEVRRRRQLLRRSLAAYGTWLLVGLGLGIVLGHGSPGVRLAYGAGGLLLAAVLASIATMLLRVSLAVREALRTRSRS